MISWGTIIYGALLSGGVALVILVLVRERSLSVLLPAALVTVGGAIAWNAILRATDGASFFVDAPIVFMPASWQDLGSGVFVLAATSLLFGSTILRNELSLRTAKVASLCALCAFLVDVYLY